MARRYMGPLRFIHFTAEDDRGRVAGKGPKQTENEAQGLAERMSMPGQKLHVGHREKGDPWYNFSGESFIHGFPTSYREGNSRGDGLMHEDDTV